jgi:hypothetical protein
MSDEIEPVITDNLPTTPKSHWYYFWRWGLEQWRLLFTAFQALGGLTIATLAIWGVFFTNFPETVVRQLRADVADAREELSGLRGERNRLLAQLDQFNSDLRIATERTREAEVKLAAVGESFNATSTALVAAQAAAKAERDNVEQLRAQMETIKASSAIARSQLEGLEKDIARLSAERENYLKVTRGSEFALARVRIMAEVQKYKRLLDYAKNYNDAPRWDAEVKAAKVKSKYAWYDEISALRKSAGRDEEMRWVMFQLGPPEDNLEVATARIYNEAPLLRPISARVLILEQINKPGSLTPRDYTTFLKAVTDAMQTRPILNQSLLVQKDLVTQRGEAASREIARAANAIASTEQFLEQFQGQVGR